MSDLASGWKKFLSGPFKPENHLKVVVFGFILVLWFCLFWIGGRMVSKAISFFEKKQPQIVQTEGGDVDQSVRKNDITLFNFGGKNL